MDYQVGLYIRLSKEDESEGQSESVTNQLSLLTAFAKEHKLCVFDTYIDDGWSGTNFDRPAFQRMIADIEAKKVNMVITKGLSRLGRDYIMASSRAAMAASARLVYVSGNCRISVRMLERSCCFSSFRVIKEGPPLFQNWRRRTEWRSCRTCRGCCPC